MSPFAKSVVILLPAAQSPARLASHWPISPAPSLPTVAAPSVTGLKAHATVHRPRSIVHRPSSDGLESLPYCRLRSAVCGLFIVSSCLRGEKRINHQDTKAQSFSSPLVHRRSSRQAAVRGLHSLIRSPFVDGFPPDRLESPPYHRPLSTVHRPFRGLTSAVRRPPFVDSFPIR